MFRKQNKVYYQQSFFASAIAYFILSLPLIRILYFPDPSPASVEGLAVIVFLPVSVIAFILTLYYAIRSGVKSRSKQMGIGYALITLTTVCIMWSFVID